MAKTENGRLAIAALKLAGIEVNEDWDDAVTEFGSTQFAIANKSSCGVSRYFDMSGDWIKESIVNGEVVNRSGVRHCIVEMLEKFSLEYDFHDRGTLAVYDIKEQHRTPPCAVEPLADDRPMSPNAFTAFKNLARIGAPVWDFDNYSNSYDPETLPAGTQFVMTCEPDINLVFADHEDNCDSNFSETDGLRSDVYEIISALGLGHRPHVHYFEDSRFRPKYLVAFYDPIATNLERGTKTT